MQLVVLAWCESAYDLSQLTRVLGQACYAFSGQGGGVVVVLTQVGRGSGQGGRARRGRCLDSLLRSFPTLQLYLASSL